MKDLGALIGEKNKMHQPDPWIWLLEIAANDSEAFRIAAYQTDVTFASTLYKAHGFEVSELPEDGQENPSLTLAIPAPTFQIHDEIDKNNAFVGAKAWIRLVHSQHLADPTAKLEARFRITAPTVTAEVLTVELGRGDLYARQTPKGTFNRNFCRHIYTLTGDGPCGYVGALAVCDHTLRGTNGCIAHGDDEVLNSLPRLHPRRFGGAPGILKNRT